MVSIRKVMLQNFLVKSYSDVLTEKRSKDMFVGKTGGCIYLLWVLSTDTALNFKNISLTFNGLYEYKSFNFQHDGDSSSSHQCL